MACSSNIKTAYFISLLRSDSMLRDMVFTELISAEAPPSWSIAYTLEPDAWRALRLAS